MRFLYFSILQPFYCFIVHGSFCIAFSIFLLSFALDTLESSYAMVLLPLACEPLEYLRGRFTNEEKQQDRVGCIIMLMYFLLKHFLRTYGFNDISSSIFLRHPVKTVKKQFKH